MSCNTVVFPKFSSLQFSFVSLRIIITLFFFFFNNEKTHLWAKCKYFGSALTRLLTPLLSSNQASSWLGRFDLLWGFAAWKHTSLPSAFTSGDGLSQITETERHDPKLHTAPDAPPAHAAALLRASLLHSGLSHNTKQPPSFAALQSFLSQSISPFCLVVWTSAIQRITDPSRKKHPSFFIGL